MQTNNFRDKHFMIAAPVQENFNFLHDTRKSMISDSPI